VATAGISKKWKPSFTSLCADFLFLLKVVTFSQLKNTVVIKSMCVVQ
jgi:hypothetical protein